ncbi:MAG: ABC transporter ATP-binding protein [Candidatus Thorarchaeota archaeon]
MKIILKNVTRTYGHKRKIIAVNNVNLEITNQIFGLIGPNGAGKTTIIRMLCGLLQPDSGSLHIDDMDCWREAYEIKKKVSFLHEVTEYPAGISGLEYLIFIGRIRGMQFEEAKRQAQQLIRYLKLEDSADRWIVDYSKGMKQLIGVAASFMGNPSLIILDEPTANLDPNGRFLVLDLIKQHFTEHGVGFLISSHILHELERISTEVGFLFNGRIIAKGSPTHILSDLPRGNVVIRATKLVDLYSRLKELYPEMAVQFQDNELVVENADIQETSQRIHQGLQDCGGVLLEFRQEEGNLERAFKELARRNE